MIFRFQRIVYFRDARVQKKETIDDRTCGYWNQRRRKCPLLLDLYRPSRSTNDWGRWTLVALAIASPSYFHVACALISKREHTQSALPPAVCLLLLLPILRVYFTWKYHLKPTDNSGEDEDQVNEERTTTKRRRTIIITITNDDGTIRARAISFVSPPPRLQCLSRFSLSPTGDESTTTTTTTTTTRLLYNSPVRLWTTNG